MRTMCHQRSCPSPDMPKAKNKSKSKCAGTKCLTPPEPKPKRKRKARWKFTRVKEGNQKGTFSFALIGGNGKKMGVQEGYRTLAGAKRGCMDHAFAVMEASGYDVAAIAAR